MNKPWRDESILRNAYLELGEQEKVASRFGCSTATIINWMDKFDIETKKKNPEHPFYHEEKLRSLYKKHKSVERVREVLDCSPNHLKKWMEYHEIERNWKHKDRGEKVEISCENCGTTEIVYKSTVNPDHNWYCSHSCMGDYFSENYTGESSPSWKGGSDDYGSEWYEQRNKVRERDENECQKCGDNDAERIPDVHHIEPLVSFDEPNDAHSLENLIQLCRPCHYEIEKYSPQKQREILNIE